MLFLSVLSVRMKLLIAAAAVLAVATCARVSLEDMEFHAWKLKFGELVLFDRFLLLWSVNKYSRSCLVSREDTTWEACVQCIHSHTTHI